MSLKNKIVSAVCVISMLTTMCVMTVAKADGTPKMYLKVNGVTDDSIKLDLCLENVDKINTFDVKVDYDKTIAKDSTTEEGKKDINFTNQVDKDYVTNSATETGFGLNYTQVKDFDVPADDVIAQIEVALNAPLTDVAEFAFSKALVKSGSVVYNMTATDDKKLEVVPAKAMPAAQLSISAENNILDKDESTKLNVTSKFFDPAPTFEESNFSVAGNTSKDTKVVKDGEDFKLNIGADETASKVTVTVKADDVTASVDVKVKGIVLTAEDANVVKGGKTELKVTQNNVSETFTEANFTVEGNSSADTKVTVESGKYYLKVSADETASKITVKFAVSTYTASVVVGVADVVCNWTNSKFTVSAGNTATANLKVSGIPEGVKYTVKYVVTSGDEYASVSSSSSTSAKIKGIKAGSAIVTAYVYLGENTGKDYVAEADLLVTVTKKSTSGNNSSSNGSTSGGSIAGGTVSGGSTGVNISTRPDSYNPQFADLNEASWAADAINSLAKKGILTGRTDTEFAPNASVTRAEFVKMVSTLYNLVTPTSKFATQSFKDVPKDAWFFNYVEVCAQLGIVNGEGDGYFNPNALISRQEMAAIMYRTATIMGTKLTATEAVKTFADANEISDYAKAAVSALQTAGIISGTSDTTFEPALACTRAQAAVIINNMYTKYAK